MPDAADGTPPWQGALMRDTPSLAGVPHGPDSGADATVRVPGQSGEEAVRGLLLVSLAFGVVSCADAAVKWVLPEIGPAAAMVWRGLLGASVVALLSRGRGLLAARSVLHAAVSACWYLAWALGFGLADSYAVAAACPLLMTILAVPMLGERVGWRRWASTAAGFAGVLFMLQPGGELWRWETPMLLAATAAMALTRIWTRVLAATDSPGAVAFWLMAAHVPAGFLLLLVPGMGPPGGGPPPLLPGSGVLLALLAFGAANGIAHLMFARAFALAPVAAIAPFEYSPLLWGTLLGFAIWGEVPAWTTLAGSAVVVAAGLYNLHRERVRRAEERAAAAAEGR